VHDSRRTRLVLAVLLVAALAMITINYQDGSSSPLSGLNGFGNTVFGPVEHAAGYVTQPVAQLFDGVTGGPSAGSKISTLQKQNAQLRAQLSQAELDKADSAQLKQLLQLAGRGGYRVVAADVVAVAAGYESTVTLDAGSADGIKDNQTVLNGDGLVGHVVSVSSDTSTVLLADDASSSVGARVAGSGEIGAVTGMGKGLSGPDTLQLEVFAANAGLQPGQQVVTLGSIDDSPYVPGVPIGTVIKVEPSANSLTGTALLRPFVDFSSLGVVGVVIAAPRVNPRNSVLPPAPAKPKPTPTVTVTVTPKQYTSQGQYTPTTTAGG
jgi:rod shape-determining protein MreC